MRIVTRAQLMAMPAGTLFHEWEPCIFGALMIKGETWESDFYSVPVPWIDGGSSDETFDRQIEMRETGASYPIDLETCGRDGLFDDRLLYAVWERADVAALHAKLGAILSAASKVV